MAICWDIMVGFFFSGLEFLSSIFSLGMFYQLTAGDLPLRSKPASRNKRERDSDYPNDPNERKSADIQKDPHAAGNLYGGLGSSDSPTSEPMDICIPAPSTSPSSSQWNTMTRTVSLSTKDPQAQWGQSMSASSQWPRSQAHSIPMNSNELGRVDFHGQADSSDHIDEQDSRVYSYYEPSSSSLPKQGPGNPGYMLSYRCDGYPH